MKLKKVKKIKSYIDQKGKFVLENYSSFEEVDEEKP
jgi:hypothetical protein